MSASRKSGRSSASRDEAGATLTDDEVGQANGEAGDTATTLDDAGEIHDSDDAVLIDDDPDEVTTEDEDLDGADRGASSKRRRSRASAGAGVGKELQGGAAKGPGAFRRLYHGQTSFDFVGRKKWWFALSGIIIIAGVFSLGIRGFNLGIEFKGGTSWEVLAPGVTVSQAQTAVERVGLSEPTVEVLGGKTVEVQADLNSLPAATQKTQTNAATAALAHLAHKSPNQVSIETVGPTWGGQVTQKAIIAVIVFFIAIAVYISFRFEWKMAVAAIIAVIHDLLVTAGVYSLVGLQVTPDTVIAILTILGYSLYDTVVVFDRIRDNTKGLGASGRMTYSDMVNLSMNQTLARSMNTSLVAIMPVFAILVVGAQILGATTLQEFGLALLIGLISGAYSSIFIASPVLAMMKEREQRYLTIRQRLDSRGDRLGILTPTAAAALAGGGSGARSSARSDRPSGALRPGAANAKRAGARTGAARGAAGARRGSGDEAEPRDEGEMVKAGATASSRPRGGSRPGGPTGARRPPPRPRKGGGKSKKRRR